MRPAYGAEEIGIGGLPVTIVVDVANVMGSRPDGWWRDRAGAAARLHAAIAQLAASGRATLPDDDPRDPGDDPGATRATPSGPGSCSSSRARPRPPPFRLHTATPAGPVPPGEVRVVHARGSGDDAIVAVTRELPGRRVVVTADRELRDRSVAAGATVLGPGWLLGQLPA